MRLSVLLALVGCANDQAVTGKDAGDAPFDTSGTDWHPDTAGDSTAEAEPCDGVDNDGDGLVDEDWPDSDGDGRADCIDAECPALDLPSAGTVATDAGCPVAPDPVADPWAVRVAWEWTGPASDSTCFHSYAMPAVGTLDDDDGDGDVDADDDADIVIGLDCGDVVALDGATGAEEWLTVLDGWPMVSIADADGDGRPDVLTADHQKATILLDGQDGHVKWTATELAEAMYYVFPEPADLDGDGSIEIVNDDLVLDGTDGSLLWHTPLPSTGMPYRMAAAADVDGDGVQEVALAGHLYEADGTERWDAGMDGPYGFWPFFVQADADDDAEIGFVGDGLQLFDTDGTPLVDVPFRVLQPGPPCVGDFDGDGAEEIAVPDYDVLTLYETDGTVDWEAGIHDFSGISGCSGADLDGDGALEVLYADEVSFQILDGRTGAQHYVDTTHSSSTAMEYPVAADLDGDGHAEILVVESYAADHALVVYTHDGDGWAPSNRTWPTHQYTGTNVTADDTVPAHPDPAWLGGAGGFRALGTAPGLPDLTVVFTDVCVADCTWGPVELGVQVGNAGTADVAAGVPLRVYADDGDTLRLVAELALPEVPAGTTLDAVQLDLSPADVGIYGWRVVVDEDGAVSECDETDDADTWTDVDCG